MADVALTTVDRIRQLPSMSKLPTSANAALTQFIVDVSNLFEIWSNRVCTITARTDEVYDGDNGESLLLNQFPVVSLDAPLGFLDDNGTRYDMATTNFNFDPTTGEVKFLRWSTDRTYVMFPRGSQNILVTYTAGLGVSATDTTTPFPPALQRGIALWVQFLWQLTSTNLIKRGVKIGDYEYTNFDRKKIFPNSPSEPPDEALVFLSRYRAMRV